MSCHTSETKLKRKTVKYASILHKLYGKSPSSKPSQCLMVCNAGLSLGVNKEDLLEFFGKYGNILSINVVSKESHSFIEFISTTEAEYCFNQCNGKLSFSSSSGPLYLLYLDSLPVIKSCEVFTIPPGCFVLENFVSEKEECELLGCVKNSFLDSGNLKQRKVAHFGYEFIYGKNNINKDKPLDQAVPSECHFLKNRLAERGFELEWEPDQLTVNQYCPGQGIPPHIDTHSAFEDPILSLSLSSDSVMEFRNDKKHWSVFLPRRSLLVMSQEGRYAWSHGITSRKNDIIKDRNGCLITNQRGVRISFTFRKIRCSPCDCNFEEFCDSRISPNSPIELPTALEEEYVHKVYENISDHFSRTRHKPWPAILELVKSLSPGSVVLDVGCGNCKYFGFATQTYELGCDHSFGLLNISKERGFNAVRSNCLALPFKDSEIDCVLCIAVLHHLSSKDRRVQGIKEILRVLTRCGKALIYVWAKDQKYQGKASNYIKSNARSDDKQQLNLEHGILPLHINRTDFTEGENDVFVPWKLKSESSNDTSSVHLRYYHVFDQNELDNLCVEAGGKIINSYYDNGNWCCLITKSDTS